MASEGDRDAPDWLLQHPKLLQMKKYAFGNPPQMHATLQVYLDLTEVKLWLEATIHPCLELKLTYLTAQECENRGLDLIWSVFEASFPNEGSPLCILPLPATTELSMSSFQKYFDAIKNCGGTPTSFKRLTIALVATDSTIVYYHLHDGMKLPTD